MKNLFIFPNAIHTDEEKEVKLNIKGKVLYFWYGERHVMIDTEVLRDGSSTMILNNPLLSETYVLYNFRETLEVLAMTPSEMLSRLQQQGLMQIDKCGGEVYIKVFLPGDYLESDTHDFSSYAHYTKDYIHPLDWRYSWTLKEVAGNVENGMLHLELELVKSDFWQRDIYLSHAGQYALLQPGKNKVEFKYIPTENTYVGNPNCRYTGRAIELDRLLR